MTIPASLKRAFGDKTMWREDKSAPTKAAKQKMREQRAAANARQAAAAETLERLGCYITGSGKPIEQRLLAAARFVADVNGDTPSIDQLREVLADYAKAESAVEERDGAADEIKRLSGELSRYRCTIGRNAGYACIVGAQGDSWPEVESIVHAE